MNQKRLPLNLLRTALFAACGALLGSCATTQDDWHPSAGKPAGSGAATPVHPLNEPQRIAREGLQAMQAGELETASMRFNQALQLDVTNPYLQFLNGLTYHRMFRQGDSTKGDLAENGYRLAIQFDASNWIPYFYMGQLYLDQRKYKEAQGLFADGLLLNADDQDLLYGFSVASYYANDPEAAAGALEKLRAQGVTDLKVLRASSIVMAALNDPSSARHFLEEYRSKGAGDEQVETIRRRNDQWLDLHRRLGQGESDTGGLMPVAVMTTTPMMGTGTMGTQMGAARPMGAVGVMPGQLGMAGGRGAMTTPPPGPEDKDNKRRMVIVDVVMIRTEENISSSKGVNLLNGLKLQFGGLGVDMLSDELPAYQHVRNSNPEETGSETIIRALSIPAITYSLNIANANAQRNELLARPSLIAMEAQESTFFSGLNITAAAVGGSNGDGATVKIDKDVGVQLKVLPHFLDDGRVQLTVTADRTYLATPNTQSVTFEYRIDTSLINVSATVAMNYGETLILSGLSEKAIENNRDGVPLLQDVPLLQYGFSQSTTTDYQKSVLILLTPREPPYVYQEGNAADSKGVDYFNPALNELKSRYADWFKPYPNWASVFHHMQANKLYREFRTGDVTLERWENFQSHQDRLRQITDFLYF